ncbi:MAG: hypothetical protein VX278_20455 [Myxococcota bacterium]|nr:hypothetical protein [Myxococcota bacterium]
MNFRVFGCGIALLFGSGCGAMNTARPLKEGQHAVGLVLGGAVLEQSVSATEENPEGGTMRLPLPIAIIEGRHGLKAIKGRALDVQYGLNLTGLAFEHIGLQGGVSYLIMEQDGYKPAWSVNNRLYFYNNWFSGHRTEESQGWWMADQIETTISWQIRGQMIYMGIAQTIDFKKPSLLLSPFGGMELIRSGNDPGFGLQLELRYYGINRNSDIAVVRWYEPLNVGAFGMVLGMNYRFGAKGEE